MGSSVLDHSGCGEGMKRCYTNMRMEDLCLRHSSLPSMTFPPCRTFMTPPCPLDTAVWLLTTSKFFHLCQYSFKHPGISHWTLLPETPSSTWKKKKKKNLLFFSDPRKTFPYTKLSVPFLQWFNPGLLCIQIILLTLPLWAACFTLDSTLKFLII